MITTDIEGEIVDIYTEDIKTGHEQIALCLHLINGERHVFEIDVEKLFSFSQKVVTPPDTPKGALG